MKPKHLVIDGYNVLGAMGWPPWRIMEAGGQVLDDFLDQVSVYAQQVAIPITVIFDAWRQPGKTRQVQHRTGISVIYSREGERADQILQQIIRQHGKETGIVSSDNEILQVARAHGAFVFRSQEFVSKLSAKRVSRNLQQSGDSPLSEKDEDVIPAKGKEKKGNPRKLPKKMRQRNRIMGKF